MANSIFLPTGDYVGQWYEYKKIEGTARSRGIIKGLRENNLYKKFAKKFKVKGLGEVGILGNSDGWLRSKTYNRYITNAEIERKWGKILTQPYLFPSRGSTPTTIKITKNGFGVWRTSTAWRNERGKKKKKQHFEVVALFYVDSGLPVMGTRNFIKQAHWLTNIGKPTRSTGSVKWSSALKNVFKPKNIFKIGLMGAAMYVLPGKIGALANVGKLASFSGLAAIGGVVAGVGGIISTFGAIVGSKTLTKLGIKIGAVGSALNLMGSGLSQLSTASAAKANASTLPSSKIAQSQGLSATSSTYGASAMSGNSQMYLTRAMDIADFGMSAFSAVRGLNGAFREPNQFNDEDMPKNNDEKQILYMNSSDLENIGRRFYERDVEYDLGLEQGTLMSNDGSLL